MQPRDPGAVPPAKEQSAAVRGEAGVGKTAIAEGLAKRRIVDSEVPEVLAAATVFSLDMGTCAAPARAIAATSKSA
ncbi:hypothetical protein ACRAWF_06520 [Streptomyces sp. L7]